MPRSSRRKAPTKRAVKAPAKSTVSSESALLKLPAELRVLIYDFAIVSNAPLRVCSTRDAAQPALTQTCRQIRKECLPSFYAKNRFRIDTMDTGTRPDVFRHQLRTVQYVQHCTRTLDDGSASNGEEQEQNMSPLHVWLQAIGPKNIRQVKEVVLAFHEHPDAVKTPLPDNASVILNISRQTKKPYYTIGTCEMTYGITRDIQDSRKVFHMVDITLNYQTNICGNTTCSKADLVELTEQFCRHARRTWMANMRVGSRC